jgi:hypothetical protein
VNWLDLDHETRRLDSKQVRLAIGNPCSVSYARYRRYCQVSKNPHERLTVREAASLWACRWLLYHQGKRGRDPKKIRLKVIATVNEMLKFGGKGELDRFILWCEGTRTGRQLLSIKPSRRPSRATLYRRGLSVASRYSPAASRKLLRPRTARKKARGR